jgi:hypothetical protein
MRWRVVLRKWLVVMAAAGAALMPKAGEAVSSRGRADRIARTPENFGSEACTKKRVDRCGCHRIFGIKHCHPNRRTDHCEAFAAVAALEDHPG